MTPIKWVYTGALVSKEEADGDAEFVPVLTLTDLEEWLTEQRTWHRKYHDDLRPAYDDLLAQVQAWRTPGDTR